MVDFKEGVMAVVTVILYIILGLLGLASLIGGIVCLALYARNRNKALLAIGLLLTLLIPGLAFCCVLATFVPNPMVVYAPPPPDVLP